MAIRTFGPEEDFGAPPAVMQPPVQGPQTFEEWQGPEPPYPADALIQAWQQTMGRLPVERPPQAKGWERYAMPLAQAGRVSPYGRGAGGAALVGLLLRSLGATAQQRAYSRARPGATPQQEDRAKVEAQARRDAILEDWKAKKERWSEAGKEMRSRRDALSKYHELTAEDIATGLFPDFVEGQPIRRSGYDQIMETSSMRKTAPKKTGAAKKMVTEADVAKHPSLAPALGMELTLADYNKRALAPADSARKASSAKAADPAKEQKRLRLLGREKENLLNRLDAARGQYDALMNIKNSIPPTDTLRRDPQVRAKIIELISDPKIIAEEELRQKAGK